MSFQNPHQACPHRSRCPPRISANSRTDQSPSIVYITPSYYHPQAQNKIQISLLTLKLGVLDRTFQPFATKHSLDHGILSCSAGRPLYSGRTCGQTFALKAVTGVGKREQSKLEEQKPWRPSAKVLVLSVYWAI